MKINWRLLPYGLVGAALLLAAIAAPSAWATPGQSAANQTMPTRTPPPPPPEPPPADTAVPPPPAPAATNTPAAAATPAQPTLAAPVAGSAACPGQGSLTLASDRRAIWPDANVVFTATLTNNARQPLKDIILEDQLAAGLEPGEVISGPGVWQGRTLRAALPTLAVGQKLSVVYSARVAAQPSGSAIVARVTGSTTGCPRRTAAVTLGLAPSQLPATGGSLR